MSKRTELQDAFDRMHKTTNPTTARKAMLDALLLYLPRNQAEATVEAMRTLVPVALNKMGIPYGVLKMATRYRVILTATPADGSRRAHGVRSMIAKDRLARIKAKK
jgi:hypothetical protein